MIHLKGVLRYLKTHGATAFLSISDGIVSVGCETIEASEFLNSVAPSTAVLTD